MKTGTGLAAVSREAQSHTEAPDPRLPLFFTPSTASQPAGLAFLKQASARTMDRDPDSGAAIMAQQAKALIGRCATNDPGNKVLGAIGQPVLIVSGSHDTTFPDNNAYQMFKHLKNVQLILYPDASHAALFQYPERFVSHRAYFQAE